MSASAARPLSRIIVFSAWLVLLAGSIDYAHSQNSDVRSGAGFAIGTDGQVLTYSAVVDGCGDVRANVGGESIQASIVAQDAVNGLALLKLDGRALDGQQIPSIRIIGPVKGETIVALEFSIPITPPSVQALEAEPRVGTVTALMVSTELSADDSRQIEISVPIKPQSSGGPLLDHSGHVIGVATGRMIVDATGRPRPTGAGAHDIGLAITSSVVQAFLDAHGVSYRTSGPSSSREVADIAAEAKAYTFRIDCIRRPPRPADAALPPPDRTPARQRAVLYEEDRNNPSGNQYDGTVMWHVERAAPVPGRKPDIVVYAEVDIPHRIAMRLSLEHNDDPTFPASHVVKVQLTVPLDAHHGGISNVPGVLVKDRETTRGIALNGVSVKVADNFFLVGLSGAEANRKRNIELLQQRAWINLPIVYSDGVRALIAFEKGPDGTRAIVDALSAWDGTGESGATSR